MDPMSRVFTRFLKKILHENGPNFSHFLPRTEVASIALALAGLAVVAAVTLEKLSLW